ncbi:cupin domain-containing protein [Streptosporangium saharense]|uniref:cupin domain-containing protein n=1 Tax=Streptosporangium saharense TaxID=1706840 RepID=UPI003694A40D
MPSANPQTGYSYTRDLVGRTDARPYLFVEHALDPRHASPFRIHPGDHRSFVVTRGQVEVESSDEGGTLRSWRYGPFEGWHVPPGCVYRITNTGEEPAVFVEAGSTDGETREASTADPLRGGTTISGPLEASRYTVDKPWGHEVWYTQNVPGVPYAVKQIHMTAGHQSSLQSHQYKRETNYVVEGEATVLDGLLAPEDLDAVVELDRLTTTVHRPGSGWSSAPRVLHRVVAVSDYTSIEVSTPELDDVIRWQDDTGRGNGRIDAEHVGGRV